MIRCFILVLYFIFLFTSCGVSVSKPNDEAAFSDTSFELLQEALDDSQGSLVGLSMAIKSPKLSKPWNGAKGFDAVDKKNKLAIEQPFRIASITKTFVATAILRLHEMDSLSIEDPVSKFISTKHINLLSKDGYNLDEIKIKHCLNHTSGLYDYAMGGREYIDEGLKNPNHRWTRTTQLQGAVDWGDRLGNPGGQYAYSDTGYILLGEIIEHFFQGDLALGLRTLLAFDQLGLNHTYLETLEETPSNLKDPVHRYLGKHDLTLTDASLDLYGGGGLVSTTHDLAVFMHALFNDQVFKNKNTLKLMLTKPVFPSDYEWNSDRRFKDYRYGLWEVSVYGKPAYLHNGLWGTMLLHVPTTNTTIALNATKGQAERLMKKTILLMENL